MFEKMSIYALINHNYTLSFQSTHVDKFSICTIVRDDGLHWSTVLVLAIYALPVTNKVPVNEFLRNQRFRFYFSVVGVFCEHPYWAFFKLPKAK